MEDLLKEIPHYGESTVPQHMAYGELESENGPYLQSESQISQETIDNTVDALASNLKGSFVENESAGNYSDVYCYDIILIFAEDQSSDAYSKIKNRLYIILACDEYKNGDFLRSFYYPFYFDNITINNAGTAEVDVEMANAVKIISDIGSYVTDINNDFGTTYEYHHFSS